MKRLFLNIIIFSSCILFVLSSCGDNNADVNLRLTHAENKEINTLYTNRLDSLRPLWDSLCVLNHDSMVTYALDSIIKERLEEETLLRNRLNQ